MLTDFLYCLFNLVIDVDLQIVLVLSSCSQTVVLSIQFTYRSTPVDFIGIVAMPPDLLNLLFNILIEVYFQIVVVFTPCLQTC